jgi:hypothetical protein
MSNGRTARKRFALVLLSDGERCSCAQGFIMLEVLAAVALLSLFLVALSVSLERAVASARQVRDRSAEASGSLGPSREVDPWSWGPQVLDGYWEAGPVLHLRTPRLADPSLEAGADELLLGLWVDGWSVRQEVVEAEESGTLRLDALWWAGCEGKEVVVRLRVSGQGWGPPWRTVVPCASRHETGPNGIDPSAERATGSVVVHPATLGTLAPQVTAAGAPVPALTQGPPWLFEPQTDALWQASLTGREQAWRGETGRRLDVYY